MKQKTIDERVAFKQAERAANDRALLAESERRNRERLPERDAAHEEVQALRVRYAERMKLDPRLPIPRGCIDDGYLRRNHPDYGRGLPVEAPWVDALGVAQDVEELCFE